MKEIKIKKRLKNLINLVKNNEFAGFSEKGKDYTFIQGNNKIFSNLMLRNVQLVEKILKIKQDPELVKDEYGGIWLSTNTINDNFKYNKKTYEECINIINNTFLEVGKNGGFCKNEFCNHSKYIQFLNYVLIEKSSEVEQLILSKL